MAKPGLEMLVIDKVYEFTIWTTNHVSKFPKSYRFTIGDRIQLRLTQILETLVRSKYTQHRASLLREANLDLELLRFQFRMAKDLKCLSLDSYGHASRAVNEVGRMVGGWMKRAAGPGAAPPES